MTDLLKWEDILQERVVKFGETTMPELSMQNPEGISLGTAQVLVKANNWTLKIDYISGGEDGCYFRIFHFKERKKKKDEQPRTQTTPQGA